MTKEEINNMSTEQVQQDSTSSTGGTFKPYSVKEDVVNTSRAQVFRPEIINVLSTNHNEWFCVDESFFTKEEKNAILSKRSTYYTAGNHVRRKYSNIEFRVKGGMESTTKKMTNGFDFQSDMHVVRLYAMWTS